MRWVISSAAFFIPFLLLIAIAGTCSTPPAPPAFGSAELAELRTWVGSHLQVLEHYAPRPGAPDSSNIPHLALERFDRRGCDADGNPWYRLARSPAGVVCGVLRQDSAKPALPGGKTARLIAFGNGWSYWERILSGPQAGP